MNKRTFFIFLSIYTIVGYSQVPDWNWLRFLSSNQDDSFADVAVDQEGNAYVCGTFFGPSVTFAGQTFNSVENSAAILVKRDANGGLVWARAIDGAECFAVDVDAAGNSYITGYFEVDSVDFGTTTLYNPARFNTSIQSSTKYAAFLVKFDPLGNVLWAKSFDNQIDAKTKGIDVKIDQAGNCYLAGSFFIYNSIASAELSLSGISLAMYPGSGLEDVFLIKYNSNGDFQWIRTAGGTSFEEPTSLAIDAIGNVIMAGVFGGNIIEFDANSILTQNNPPNNSRTDFFIAKYTSQGDVISASQSLGGGTVRCEGIATDNEGNCFITGYFNADTLYYNGVELINSDTTSSGGPAPLEYYSDMFIYKINQIGEVLWAKSFGLGDGYAIDYAYGITTDSDGNCYITGTFSNEINFGDINLLSNGNGDVFVTKIDPDGNPLWAQSAGGSSSERGFAIVIDASNNVFISGSYDGGTFGETLNFGSLQATYFGSNTGFLAKLGFNTVNVANTSNSVQLAVSPNPSSGNFTIQLNSLKTGEKAMLRMLDISGRIVHEQEIKKGINGVSPQIELANGVYVLHVAFADGSVAEPLIIQN